ncbi:hypothetical protein RhiTH_011418 [Rhizoctonia solani]
MDNVISEAPALPIGSTLVVPDDGADYDPEGIRTLLFMSPTMDRNTPDNSLSFVLQCYSQWAIFSTFEPLEMVHRIRDNVIQRFASEDTRIKTILMANVMRGFPQDLAIGGKSMSVLTYLAHEVQKSGSYYTTKLYRPKLDEDKRNAMYILDHAFEVVTLQLYTQPTIAFAKSFDEIAAIFRYACPDLPGNPINLPKIMLGPDTSLQWFACMDITHGVLTGKPTYFQYDVPFSLHLCEQTPSYQSFQSIYGIPDQIIMFFAWVNSLCETPRTGDSREMVAWAEQMLPQIKFTAGESGDPLLRLVRAQRGLMRLIKGIKQGRNPDLFLAPMAICRRCLASGKTCAYDYVEYPGTENHRIRRTKPAPRTTLSSLTNPSKSGGSGPPRTEIASLADPSSSEIPNVLVRSTWARYNNEGGLASDVGQSYDVDNSLHQPSAPPTSSQPHFEHYSVEPSSVLLDLDRATIGGSSVSLVSGSASDRPTFGNYNHLSVNEEGHPYHEHQAPLYNPAMDKNVKDNTLPFVLQCYSQRANSKIFEPDKVIHGMRDQVIERFSTEDWRTRTILIANVMIDFTRNFKLDDNRAAILDHLDFEIRKKSHAFMSTPPSLVPVINKLNATTMMDGMLEATRDSEKQKILGLQIQTRPFAVGLRLLDDIAPVFRRTCPEGPGNPINLVNILVDPNFNLRHFAASDIMVSVTTGQPTYFQYEVAFSLEICERMYEMRHESGLQSFYGIPNEFILLFAWINSMCEKPGASENLGLITCIDDNVSKIKVVDDQSSDPLLRIGRMAVQECWRFAIVVYLYMKKS